MQGGADDVEILGGVGWGVAWSKEGGGLRRGQARVVVSGRLTSISPLSRQGPWN